MGDGTSYQIEIGAAGAASVNAAAASVDTLAVKLAAATTASTAANAAMQASEAAYRQAESAADTAAKAVEKVTASIATQETAATKAAAKFGIFSSEYQRASDKLQKLVDKQSDAVAKSDRLKAALDGEAAALDKSKSAASAAADTHTKLSKSLDAAKTTADKVAKARAAMGGSGKVNEIGEAMGKLGGPLGVAGQKAFGAAEGFKKMGASLGNAGPYVAIAVAIVAISTAAVGATIAITAWAVKLADKEGKIAKESKRMDDAIKKTFGGLKIDKLLDGLGTMVDLFDSSTASGNAMKVVFESIFQPLIDGIADLAPKAERLFLQLEIMAMQALIAIKPYGTQIKELGAAFLIASAIVIGVVVVAIAAVIAIFVAGAAASLWFTKTLVAVGKDIINFFGSLTLESIGRALIDGLIAGLTGGGPKVIGAITGIAGDAIGAAKRALGIASPSTVFAEIGAHTAAGMAEGVEGASGGVQSSLEAMVAPPAAQAPASTSTTSSVTGGSHVFNINVSAGGDGQSIAAAVRNAIDDFLEGGAAQAGATVPA